MYLRHGPGKFGRWTAHEDVNRAAVMRLYRWLRSRESRAHARFMVVVLAEAFRKGVPVDCR